MQRLILFSIWHYVSCLILYVCSFLHFSVALGSGDCVCRHCKVIGWAVMWWNVLFWELWCNKPHETLLCQVSTLFSLSAVDQSGGSICSCLWGGRGLYTDDFSEENEESSLLTARRRNCRPFFELLLTVINLLWKKRWKAVWFFLLL